MCKFRVNFAKVWTPNAHLILEERAILRTLGAQKPIGLLVGVAVFR